LFPMISSHQRVSAPSSSSTAPNPRRKVPLTPGHSPLDWARLLTTSPASLLRGPSHTRLERYTLTQIREHRSRTDVWMAIRGKVYNCTSYVKFHPGGAGQLMRGAGKDATELFMKVHPWVNVDGLLEKCCVGYL
ncbi:cytochrome b5-like heme/steroid binding domain-containing protein, partial [Phlyctochytrium arcticum]